MTLGITKCLICGKKLSNGRLRAKKHYCSIKCKRESLRRQRAAKPKKEGIGEWRAQMRDLKKDPVALEIIKKYRTLQRKLYKYNKKYKDKTDETWW